MPLNKMQNRLSASANRPGQLSRVLSSRHRICDGQERTRTGEVQREGAPRGSEAAALEQLDALHAAGRARRHAKQRRRLRLQRQRCAPGKQLRWQRPHACAAPTQPSSADRPHQHCSCQCMIRFVCHCRSYVLSTESQKRPPALPALVQAAAGAERGADVVGLSPTQPETQSTGKCPSGGPHLRLEQILNQETRL